MLKILQGGVEVVGIVKKSFRGFSLSSVRNLYVFFANRGSGLDQDFFVSVILPATCDMVDPLMQVRKK